MKTKELLQLQVLKYKREVLHNQPGFDDGEDLPAWKTAVYDVGGESRNICAMLPLPLFEEVQRLSGILRISKRRIIELALVDFAESANKTLEDAGFDSASIISISVGQVPVDEA